MANLTNDEWVAATEALIAARDEARRRAHWHLARAAREAESDTSFGHAFDGEIKAAVKAVEDWHDAHRKYWAMNDRRGT